MDLIKDLEEEILQLLPADVWQQYFMTSGKTKTLSVTNEKGILEKTTIDVRLCVMLTHNLTRWILYYINDINVDFGLFASSFAGRVDLVKLFIDRGSDQFTYAAKIAGGQNHINVVQFLANIYDTILDWALTGAIGEGTDETIFTLVELGADIEDGLITAAKSGRINIVRYMVEHGASGYNAAVEGLISNKMNARATSIDNEVNGNVLKLLVDYGATEWDSIATAAALAKRQDIIQLCIEKGVTDWDMPLVAAAINDDEKLLRFFVSLGAAEIDTAFQSTPDNMSAATQKFFEEYELFPENKLKHSKLIGLLNNFKEYIINDKVFKCNNLSVSDL